MRVTCARKALAFLFLLALFAGTRHTALADSPGFTLDDIKSYPFPTGLTSAATGDRIAWASNQGGRRNLFVAEGPNFAACRLTSYDEDDGQEITAISFSADGKWLVYVRGGDHGANWDTAVAVNPTFAPTPPKVEIWSIPFAGGDPHRLGEGEDPTISPKGATVAFVRAKQIWTVPIDGSAEAKQLFAARGSNGAPEWSPDGTRLAFQSSREDHSLIGVYRDPKTPIQWIAPSYHRDSSPRWSPDGSRLVFIRRPGAGGEPEPILERRPSSWSIMVGDCASGEAKTVWKAPETLRGSVPDTQGGTNLHWAVGRIVFLSYQDGWPHLYSLPEQGGETLLLTPGNFMVEHVSLSPDRTWLVFSANTGPDPQDIDRRHVARVPVDRAALEVLTPGSGLEWAPVVTGTGSLLTFIRATPQTPPIPHVLSLKVAAADRWTAKAKMVGTVGPELLPDFFLDAPLVTPKQVIFDSPDGLKIHAQLFDAAGATPGKRPAIIYIHGGPPRQMLLGWHYSDYYSNAYAMNQYLASRGFIVLSVNYRLGIGYGYEFHHPANGGARGASEYQDIKAAGEWLARQPQVDARRIGIYGGSYGGFLTGLALARDSKLFAAGVAIHGVFDFTVNRTRSLVLPDRYERAPDADRASRVAWESSPASSAASWSSPVLIIHGDDDRNVAFSQSTDMIRRLQKAGTPLETMMIVDDTHHFMLHTNQMKVNAAIADFFERKLKSTVLSLK